MYAYSGGMLRTITMLFLFRIKNAGAYLFRPVMEVGNTKPIYDVFK